MNLLDWDPADSKYILIHSIKYQDKIKGSSPFSMLYKKKSVLILIPSVICIHSLNF